MTTRLLFARLGLLFSAIRLVVSAATTDAISFGVEASDASS